MARKKKKKQGAGRQNRPQAPDRRTMDETMASLGALLKGQTFESIEEANAFLQQLMEEGGSLPPPPAETPLEKAQAVMYEAFEARGRGRRIKLAKKALSISPDCADAYVLLAQEDARSLRQANNYYAQGVQAGRRALGEEAFEEEAGHFWLMIETRPFMRAMEGYAMTLWALGQREASVEHQQEMLRLNPGDNQGIRYWLIHCLLALRRLDDVEQLFEEYDKEPTANFAYPRALTTFLKEGPTPKANLHLRQVFDLNPHLPAYLLGEKRMPRNLPDHYGMGDENEAILYVRHFGEHWRETAGALSWLRNVREQPPVRGSEVHEESLFSPDPDLMDDEWYYADEYDGFPPFELDEFLADFEFPKSEHGSIRRCLSVGLGKYLNDVYGEGAYGKQPTHLIDEVMHLPYVFGYGALEVIRHKRLRPDTKLAVCSYVLEAMDLDLELGIPYGLLALLGYMASQNVLHYESLLYAAIALGFGAGHGYARAHWLEGVDKEDLLRLVDWIAGHEDIPADEKLWWAWKLAVQSDNYPHAGKAMAKHWLSLEALTTDAKRALCRGWLDNKDMVGTPPLVWQLYQATLTGQRSEVERLVKEHNLEPGPEAEVMLAEMEKALAEIEPGSVEAMMLRMRSWVMVPAFLHRLAIPALVRLGDDLETIVGTYWNTGSDYNQGAQSLGAADAIREFSHRLSSERLRELIERGVNHSLAPTRKAYYILSEEFYGDEYLQRALQDNAGSLRTWAAKKLARRR